MSGAQSLQALIDKVRRIGGMPVELAKRAAPAVQTAARATAAAGTTPTGQPWKPRKDGSPALQNAASAIVVRPNGAVLQIVLQGTSTGSAKVQAIQSTRRAIIPGKSDEIPPGVSAALKKQADALFQQIVGGR